QAWAAAAPAAARPVTAAPPLVIGSAQQSLINQDRASAGLPPLSWSGCLAGIAGGQAQAMAAAGTIFHGNGVQRDWSCGLNSAQRGQQVVRVRRFSELFAENTVLSSGDTIRLPVTR